MLFIVDDKKYLFDGKAFSEAPKKTKEYYSATTLMHKDIRTYGFKAFSNISVEKLAIQAEMKMYDEGGLDSEVDYSIDFVKIPIDGTDEDFIESYAVTNALLQEKFQATAKKLGALDFIYPTNLSYQALYASELLERKNDIFIHFGDTDAYAIIFKEGNYVSTRSISSLSEIGEKIGDVDASDMRKILSTKGVKNDLYTPDEFLRMSAIEEQLLKIVEKIAHTIGHKRGAFKLDEIDRIFLDFEGSDIPGFLELFDSYGYENSSKEVLDLFESVEAGMKHRAINALYALTAVQKKAQILNLTIFERKPAFIKTHVGQFSLVLLSAFILSSLYPLYATYTLNGLKKQENNLKNQVSRREQATKKLSDKLKKTRAQRDKLIKQKQEDIEKISSYGYMLQSLENIKQNIHLRQQMMQDINTAMKKYKLSSKNMEIKDSKNADVQIITTYDQRDRIAEFIKDLLSKGYSHVQTKKVEKNKTYYESFVEISR